MGIKKYATSTYFCRGILTEKLAIMDYFNSWPTHMDFKGQEQAENWSRIVVMLFGAVGLIYGWMIQEFSQTIYILAAGLALAALVSLFVFLATFTKSESIMVLSHMQLTVPPWSFFRKKPLKWQKARDPDTGES